MTAVADQLPLTDTQSPADQSALVAAVAGAVKSGTPIYPIGGGTSLDWGLAPTRPGIGLELTQLNRVIDYPARDMTITVESGITMRQLADVLAAERQWLPIDAPTAERATLGGVMATATSGPRRYGYGTMRDYVIGVSAVDGHGKLFKAGGRVVKNVAGYDFCKLLTGSLGTLGVISQVTLKIRPRPESSAFAVCDLTDFQTAERLLADIVTSATTPAAVELLVGHGDDTPPSLGPPTAGTVARLVVGIEGTAPEVEWMLDQSISEWRAAGVTSVRTLFDDQAAGLWSALTEFPVAAPEAPLVIKASLLPSRVTQFVQLMLEIDPGAAIVAHAGNGIVVVRFARFEAGDVSRVLIGRIQPTAALAGGHAVVLSSTLGGLTRQAIWGGTSGATAWMTKVKRQFDPQNLLNPGRFVYDA